MTRVALIGLDAAELRLVETLMASGEMPNLAGIKRRSATARLQGEATRRSGREWEAFLTGVAGGPGVIDFDPATYGTARPGARRDRPFYATTPALRVVSLDVPYTGLWCEVPGAQVSAWGSHGPGQPRASRPAGLVREIDAIFGPHPAQGIDVGCGWHHAPAIQALFEALVTGARRRAGVAYWLQESFKDWDLFMTVLSEAHSAGHLLWHGLAGPLADADTAALARARLVELHRVLDEVVARLVSRLSNDAKLVVCSLHGMQENDCDLPSMVLLPELLQRRHFGRALLKDPDQRSWRAAGCPPLAPGPDQSWDRCMRERFGASAAGRLRRDLALALPRTARAMRALDRWLRGEAPPPPLEKPAAEIPPESDLAHEASESPREALDWQVPCWYRGRWPRMRAFALPAFRGGRVRVNLRGRERDGIVAPEDYESVCSWVEELLGACRNPRDGRPAVERIDRLRPEDPIDPEGPDADLLITWSQGIDALKHPELGTIGPFPHRRTGRHTSHGFAYFAGPGIEPRDLGDRDALDLAPTILALLGRDPPQRLAGRAIPI